MYANSVGRPGRQVLWLILLAALAISTGWTRLVRREPETAEGRPGESRTMDRR